MNVKDVVIGMKVVPHDKTTGVSLEYSGVWKTAQKEQKFLYVVGKRLEKGHYIFILSDEEPVVTADGDFYCARDFEPYKEKIMEDEPEWTKGIICNPYSAEAKALIGKEVIYFDSYGAYNNNRVGILDHISPDATWPFYTQGGNGWKFIKSVPEKPAPKEMTVSEICDALGYEVKIRKE